jgi:glycosidase
LAELDAKLFEVLRAPIQSSPDSLEGQLEYILERWGRWLPAHLRDRLLRARDLLREEEKLRHHVVSHSEVLRFDPWTLAGFGDYPEDERYSWDKDWMGNLVLIAKSTYVWLDQLSKKYQRHIHRLDHIPDEELDRLARSGFSGLWLIGVWERSSASQRIKQIRGNPEALPSAYSLYDYVIASDLGGPEAYENLRKRAWERRIRLASDMVPNHVGLYSKWVVEHPDWFIQVPYSPYPNYRYNGENLSPDGSVGLYIEDGYWDGADAAVTFKRVDHNSGETRYIYHGNDGTHMPWNDTAQLDYLNPAVREAVIQTILHVARQFPIIRFDAAMTLAKKHYKRLWFPSPGEGGDIPSRSERGLSKEEFDRLMPIEFWREVVDRVAQEAPDTLLLAEAFWLMEGYFVRTLGMHRVYNSAFMNMLKLEDNANYRTTIKNVLEFSPEILRRFVNFMNNPDEETAVAQFGKGDKYFGVAVMMSTLPGLPMFGHGQVEGFTEKYGMEYRRAYWDEEADEDLVRRHEAEVFPLLHKRHIFSGSENFALYDYFTPEGYVNESVFAYSNRNGGERGLVLYNNAYASTRGWIRTSTQINLGTKDAARLVMKSLSEALALTGNEKRYYIGREHRSGLEYLFSGRQIAEQGIYTDLSGYEYKVFLGFREVEDLDGVWRRVFERLQGHGTADVERLRREIFLEPLVDAFSSYLNAETIRAVGALDKEGRPESLQSILEGPFKGVGETMGAFGLPKPAPQMVFEDIGKNLKTISNRNEDKKEIELAKSAKQAQQILSLEYLAVAWAILEPLKASFELSETGRSGFERWGLVRRIQQTFEELGDNPEEALEKARLVDVAIRYPELLDPTQNGFSNLFEDEVGQRLLHVNSHEGVLWFGKEPLEGLLEFLAVVEPKGKRPKGKSEKAREVLQAARKAGYRVESFLRELSTSF